MSTCTTGRMEVSVQEHQKIIAAFLNATVKPPSCCA